VRLVLVLGDPDAVYVCCEDQFHFRTRTVWCLGVSDPHRSMLKFKLASLLQIRGIANMDQLCFSLDVFTVLAPDVFFLRDPHWTMAFKLCFVQIFQKYVQNSRTPVENLIFLYIQFQML
jgi:hypothetical protein